MLTEIALFCTSNYVGVHIYICVYEYTCVSVSPKSVSRRKEPSNENAPATLTATTHGCSFSDRAILSMHPEVLVILTLTSRAAVLVHDSCSFVTAAHMLFGIQPAQRLCPAY